MNTRILAVLAIATAVVASGCGSSSSTTPSSVGQSNVAYSQTDLVVGTGATAFSNSTLTVTYNLWLSSETATDHKGTWIEGNANMQFVVSNTILGWRQGIAGMKVGGQRRLIVPPALGYGTTGTDKIPANSALVFDIELVSIP